MHDINRYHKIFAHRVLRDYSESIYIDGNIRFQGSFSLLARALSTRSAALGAFRHPADRSVKDEVEACSLHCKFDAFDQQRAKAQLHQYSVEGFDIAQKITANYLLVRDHSHPILPMAMGLWWSQLFEFAKRDQLSLTYALWKTGLPWIALDECDELRATDVVRNPHRKPLWERTFHNIWLRLRRGAQREKQATGVLQKVRHNATAENEKAQTA